MPSAHSTWVSWIGLDWIGLDLWRVYLYSYCRLDLICLDLSVRPDQTRC